MKINYNQGMISSFYHSKRFFIPIRAFIMFVLFSVLTTFTMYASSLQDVRITVQQKNVSLSQVFREIEKQSGFSLLIRNNDVNMNEKVSIDATNKTVEEVLEMLFSGKSLKYEVEGKRITVYRPINRQGRLSNEAPKLKGRVTDVNNEPIIGASVMIDGTTDGTITDIDGYFSLEIPKGATHLKVSYIGYTAQVVSIGNKTEVNIVMKEDSQMLDEVVVVGYGTQKKVTLTGAVASIKEAELISTKNENTQNMLTGKISGVRVMQKSAEPGSFNNNFDIRGMGDALIIIDGVPRDNMTRLSPNDIESISVLKDASAAIYGVRAANGVVLITTKKGTKDHVELEYSGNIGWQNHLVL